jgi:NADH dehydrogenase
MNLVVGATGTLGSEICRLLVAAGQPVRALIRATADADKAARLERTGVTLVRGDLKDRASLDRACRGVNTVVSTASSTISRQAGDSIETVDRNGQISLFAAAKAAGVRHAVLISFPPVDIEFPLQSAKRAVERCLVESGMPYTILQPTCFMEVWLSPALGFDAANAKAQIYGSGANRISWISYHDVATFAALSLDHAEARNATMKLGGPDALSPLEVIQIFERRQGRKYDVQFVSEESLRAQKSATTDPLQQSFAALMLYYARGEVIDMRDTLRRFPLRMRSVDEYAATAV